MHVFSDSIGNLKETMLCMTWTEACILALQVLLVAICLAIAYGFYLQTREFHPEVITTVNLMGWV